MSLPAHLYTHTYPLSVCGVPPSTPIYPYLPSVCVWCPSQHTYIPIPTLSVCVWCPSQHTYIPIPTSCLCVVSLPAYLYTHTYPLSTCGVPLSTPINPYLPSVCVWCPSQHTNNIIPIPTLCLCVVSLPAHLYTHTYPLSVCGVPPSTPIYPYLPSVCVWCPHCKRPACCLRWPPDVSHTSVPYEAAECVCTVPVSQYVTDTCHL